MEDLVLHDATRKQLVGFQASPSHSLLLIGLAGAGKQTVALGLLATIFKLSPDQLAKYPYFMVIAPVKSSIGIEQIRQAQDFVRLKTTGDSLLRRAIFMHNAETMTQEAQNAFLKLLEEPPTDTLIVLTSTGRDQLLPTIVSRAQQVVVKAPAQTDLNDYFIKQGYEESGINRAFYMSGGLPGLMTRLLANKDGDELLSYVDQAKHILRAAPFERLTIVDKFTKQKGSLGNLLWALRAVASAALQQAVQKSNPKLTRYWHRAIKQIMQAQDSLGSNPQPKLLLTDLILHL